MNSTAVSDDRGQSEVLGVALLIGVIVLAATLLAVFGTAASDEYQQRAATGQAERSFAQLDTRTSRVALGGAAVQRVDLGGIDSKGTYATRPDAGWMRVRFINETTGAPETNVTNVTLGKVVYRNRETTVAYQAGGVWRTDGGNAAMLSRPELHYRNGTLTAPIIVTQGDGAIDGDVQVQAARSERKFPNRSINLTNKINDTKVAVTVQSDYYEAWATYFREQTGGHVYVDHARETATVVFLALPETFHIREGIIATAEAGTLELHGTGAYTDSYNSTEGPWEPPDSDGEVDDGTVEAVGDVYLYGNSEVYGNVRSGGTVGLGSNSYVHHDVYWTDGCQSCTSDHVGGTDTRIDGVATIEPIDGYVYNRVGALRTDNDNANTSLITDERLVLSRGETGTLTAGRYYVDRAELSGAELVLDTSDGNITIAVEDWMLLQKGGGDGSRIRVEGDGVVRVVVASRDDADVQITGAGAIPDDPLSNFHVGKKSKVVVPGNVSTQFRVYGPRSFRGTVTGDNSPPQNAFNGLIYAPGGRTGDGYVYTKQSDVYGGIVAGTVVVGQNGKVHYDEAISDVPLPRSPTVSRLEYMQATVHRVNVTRS